MNLYAELYAVVFILQELYYTEKLFSLTFYTFYKSLSERVKREKLLELAKGSKKLKKYIK